MSNAAVMSFLEPGDLSAEGDRLLLF